MLASLCGCTICQSPYDYCTAVIGPDGCPCWCDFGARMNSAFAPPGGYAHPTYGPTEAATGTRTATVRGSQEAPPEPPASGALADEPADDPSTAGTAEAYDGPTFTR